MSDDRYEFDHTAEEVASPSLPPGCGSIVYTEEEWESLREPCTCTLACEPRGLTEEQACRLRSDVRFVGVAGEHCPRCGLDYADDNDTIHECPPGFLALADGDESLGAQGKPGRSSVAQTERPATAGDTSEADTADPSRPHRSASAPSSPSASAGPTGCLTPDCTNVDGLTRAGGVRCHDCKEDEAA